MDRWKATSLVLFGVVVGLLLARGNGIAAHAQTAGSWKCYAADRVVEEGPEKASKWRGAEMYTKALNLVSPATPAGTVFTFDYEAPTICAKS